MDIEIARDTEDINFSNTIDGFGLRTVYLSMGGTPLGDSYAVVKLSTKERWVTTKRAAKQWLLDRGCLLVTLEKLVEADNERLEDEA